MKTVSNSAHGNQTPTEAAGYIAGILTGAACLIMPIRMLITMAASMALIVFAFRTESTLGIARACCLFVVLIAILVGSAVFGKRSR